MNLLVLSCGTRNKLMAYLKQEPSINQVVATDCSPYAPALYAADSYHLVPRMTDPSYLTCILDICKRENIRAVLPLQEDELMLLAQNKEKFESQGILPIVSEASSVEICRDKYRFYQHLTQHGIPAMATFPNAAAFREAYAKGEVTFPVFLKPVRGCGSIGINKADTMAAVEMLAANTEEELLIQAYADGEELGADIYVDMMTHKPTAIFVKKKIRMRAGETEKSVSYRDEALFTLIERTVNTLRLAGPIDMDIFLVDGTYYISEINPRFGGGYPHAYECGVNFPAYMAANAAGKENPCSIGRYEEGVYMLKYSDLLIRKM